MADFDYTYTEAGEVKFKIKKQDSFFKRNLKKYWPLLISSVLTGVMAYSFHTKVWPEIEYDLEQRRKFDEFKTALESDFYDLETLTDVNTSKKSVSIDVFIGAGAQVNNYRENKDVIFRYVSDFYSGHNVDLTFNFVDSQKVSTENRTKHLSIEILEFEDFVDRSFKICNLKTAAEKKVLLSKFFNESEKFKKITSGIYHREKNALLILAANRLESDYVREAKFELEHENCVLSNQKIDLFDFSFDVSNLNKAYLIAHELGHAFGLSESQKFLNDPISEFICEYCQIPNLMSYNPLRISKKTPLGGELNDFQEQMIHSYLSTGRIYKQFELVGFDSTLWSHAVKQTNVYISKEDVEEFESEGR